MSLGVIFLSELVGTTLLLLFGVGVVANVVLAKTKGNSSGWVVITFGWGLAVFVGVLAAYKSGGHLNPAVTVGFAASGMEEFVPGIPVNIASIATYISAQLLGGILGGTLAWITYKNHLDEEPDPALKLACFGTSPQIRNYLWNTITEAIATFTLIFVILAAGKFTGNNGNPVVNLGWLGAFGVAMLIVAIGMSLGGPTGYAINPARDLGPRIAHFLVPIKGKGSSDWAYSWVPIVGPMIGGTVAGLAAGVLLP
ncbi:MAG: MIP/aquaporin family protein [Actinomycetaceae bacterium]|nr:MIP/aquaporin family protein [Actinomycetaceae bacterium]